jgi:hypothetical protein
MVAYHREMARSAGCQRFILLVVVKFVKKQAIFKSIFIHERHE